MLYIITSEEVRTDGTITGRTIYLNRNLFQTDGSVSKTRYMYKAENNRSEAHTYDEKELDIFLQWMEDNHADSMKHITVVPHPVCKAVDDLSDV